MCVCMGLGFSPVVVFEQAIDWHEGKGCPSGTKLQVKLGGRLVAGRLARRVVKSRCEIKAQKMLTWLAIEKEETKLGKSCYLFYSISEMKDTEE